MCAFIKEKEKKHSCTVLTWSSMQGNIQGNIYVKYLGLPLLLLCRLAMNAKWKKKK